MQVVVRTLKASVESSGWSVGSVDHRVALRVCLHNLPIASYILIPLISHPTQAFPVLDRP